MADHPDGFKWFGEGFDGFPKILPDDCVQYMVYIIDSKLNDFNIREQLRKVQAAANALCKELLKGFIWQRDGFGLEIVHQKGKHTSIPSPTLSDIGRTQFPAGSIEFW